MLKSTESKRSKSRSSSSSHRGSTGASCLASAFTFDGIGDFQLDTVGADQSEISDLLETLQSQDGAALMSDLSDSGCLPFDSLDSFNFGFSSSTGLGPETARQPREVDCVLDAQNNDVLSNFDAANSQMGGSNGKTS